MESTKIKTQDFEKALKQEVDYFSQSIDGTGRIRGSEKGKVNFFVVLKGENLKINRDGVYDSNRHPVFDGKVKSITEVTSIVTEKCGLNLK